MYDIAVSLLNRVGRKILYDYTSSTVSSQSNLIFKFVKLLSVFEYTCSSLIISLPGS